MAIPITGDLKPTDPLPRKRQVSETGRVSSSEEPSQGGDERADHISILSASPEEIKRYVHILKTMDPADLHHVEQLRERIQSGAYHADADELAAPLAAIIERERSGNRGA
jgi:anti-sigma28 factor (negative regulator of flagellin synthesis)